MRRWRRISRIARKRRTIDVAIAAVPAYDSWLIRKSPTSTTRRRARSRARYLRTFPAAFRRGREKLLHVDIYGWTPTAKPGAGRRRMPAARAIYKLLGEPMDDRA